MLYKIARPLVWLFTKIFYPFKVYGRENLPEGKQIVVCNHFGKIDVVFLAFLFKGKTYFLAKRELFEKKLANKLYRSLGGIPVKRDSVDLDCIREGLRVLKAGNRLAIFPEGRRNFENSELQELKPGAGMFAFKTHTPITPVMMEKKAHVFRRANLLVGKPLYLDEYYDRQFNSELNDEINARIREAMLETQRELYRILGEKKKNSKK